MFWYGKRGNLTVIRTQAFDFSTNVTQRLSDSKLAVFSCIPSLACDLIFLHFLHFSQCSL